ncbi:transglycosylase SLT domain-containing protein [Pseudoalteromonas denitrificans]|nr:transglycosylase SLT domain-containing protein [Pseudoalteromonas denitrificans]
MLKKLFIAAALFSSISIASFSANAISVEHKKFLSAEKIALSGNKKRYKKALEKLNHPLKPYVKMAYLKKYPYLSNEADIKDFLRIYQGTPLEWPVRKAWLKKLSKRNKKALFIKYFKPTKNAALTCTHLNYQLQLGAPESAIMQQVTDLWLVGKSQPKECNAIFKKWRKQGYMTPERIWHRLTLAAQKGKHTLIPYLKLQLPKEDHYLADLYYKMRKDPSASAGLYRFKKANQKESEIAIYGIKRLIWRDENLALRAWRKLEVKFNFTKEQKESAYYTFALALASKKHKEAKFWLNKVPHKNHDKKLMQWQLANMLQSSDWPGIIAYFTGKENLSNGQKYWLAFSYQEQGKKLKADEMWLSLAQKRNYYGFMSAARLNLPVQLEYQKTLIDKKLIEKVSQAPGFVRAKALSEINRTTSSRREWNYLINTSSKDEKLAAAQLGSKLNWHDRVIVTMAQLELFNYLDLRFPEAFDVLYKKYSQRSKIDLTWSYAISRRESSFAPDAYSGAGALGLMQLLPSTARYISKAKVSRKKLFDPKTNIKLGSAYLSYLKRKNHGNEILATASYNAGYHRVSKWLPKKAMPVDLWIESIPYRETRDYVKNVFAYRQVYHTRMGKVDNLFDDLLTMKIQK